MADPLSITLAVVTLSTALKDIIEVAHKLHGLFQKPRQNVKAAQALAAETLQAVELLRKFHEDHRKTLDESDEMRTEVITLWQETKAVYEKCTLILRSVSDESRLQKMKEALYSWKDGKKMEIYIRELRDQATKCYNRFMIFTLMRLEAIAVQTKGAVNEGFTSIQRQISTLRVREENIIAFIGSNPTILSSLPPHIQLSEDIVFKSYLRLQVGKIDATLKHLASSELHSSEEPDFRHRFPAQIACAIIPRAQEETEALQDDVIADTAIVLKHLKSHHCRPSIQQGVWFMRSLSVGLSLLGMFQEAVTIDSWTVNIYRTLAATNPEGYSTHLVEALYDLSVHLVNADDLERARQTIAECVDRNMEASANIGQTPTLTTSQIQTAKALSLSSLVTRLLGDDKLALQYAEKSIEMFTCELDDTRRMCNDEPSDSVTDRLLRVISPTDTMTYYYADALRQRYSSLLRTTKTEETVQNGIQALKLLRTLADKYVDIDLYSRAAWLALSLCRKHFAGVISATLALSYAEESVHYYEKICKITGVPPRDFYDALTTNAEILSELGRFDEAYAICQRTANMIEDIIDNQRLRAHSLQLLARNLFHSRRHEEAAMMGVQLLTTYRSLLSKSEIAIAYNYVSASFIWTRNYHEAVEIAEASVTHCRALALQGKQYTKYVADSLLQLSRGLFYDKNYDHASDNCYEAVKLYSALIIEDLHVLEQYKSALELNQEICLKMDTHVKPLERSQETVESFRRILHHLTNRQNWLIFIGFILNHACLLEKYDRLSDGSVAIQEALDLLEEYPAENPPSAGLHIDCLRLSGRLLHSQGYPDKAVNLFEKAVAIGLPFIYDRSVVFHILLSKMDHCFALYTVGSPIGISAIEECLDFVYEHGLEDERSFSWCLYIASLMYRSSGKADKALSLVHQSVIHDKRHGLIPMSWTLPELLADAGQEIEALDAANDAVRTLKQFENAPTREAIWFERERQYSLALRLFATGELSQARQLLVEVRKFYEQYAPTRQVLFLDLALVLRAAGILACSANRHQEGIDARKELNDLQERLRLIFPSLANLVDLALNRERNFTAWRILLDKLTLTCGHQQE